MSVSLLRRSDWRFCVGGVPIPVGAAAGGGSAVASAAGRGGRRADPLLAAALPHLQADLGPAADPRPARAGTRGHPAAAERGHQPMGPRHSDAPLQHPLHASHIPPHRHAPHPGTATLFH